MIKKYISKIIKVKREVETLPQLPEFIQEYNRTRSASNQSAICHAPASNMYFSQTGEVRVCCHNMEFVAGSYPQQTLKEIWDGPALKAMRLDMGKYRLGKGCEICLADLEQGSYEEVRARHFDNIPKRADYPTQMEFLLTNTCNLECVMCKGEFSSSIRQNREHLPPIKNVYDEAFIKQLEEFLPYLHEARFSGSGEAFLIDSNYQIWEKIIQLNPKCIIMIQTNGTVLNSRIKEFLEKGRFQIGVSLDSLKKEVFEAIRPNAKFERVIENIQYFSEYSQRYGRKFAISTCVMRQNWSELPDFIKFSNEKKAIQTFHKVWHPHEYALYNLPSSEISKIYKYLSKYEFEEHSYSEKLNKRHYIYFQKMVHNWYANALNYETEQSQLKSYSKEQLLQLVKKRSRYYLLERNQAMDGNIEQQHTAFVQKITTLLEMLPLEILRERALREMCRVEIKFVVDALMQNNSTELMNLARKHLRF